MSGLKRRHPKSLPPFGSLYRALLYARWGVLCGNETHYHTNPAEAAEKTPAGASAGGERRQQTRRHGLFQFLQDSLHVEFQFRQIFFHHCPNSIHIYSKIVMHQNVSHPNNIGPGNITIPCLKFLRKGAASLADHRQMLYHPGLIRHCRRLLFRGEHISRCVQSLRECPAGVRVHFS